ncbi:unnamed protein product, partial [Mesorhabditis belari]|uniref:V-SNARE coiled-coil homology domain-containing protein n=1 Tax=Mesorhabditis belari TaxID=2138241 RepID=A0AAF3EGF9_9BILA
MFGFLWSASSSSSTTNNACYSGSTTAGHVRYAMLNEDGSLGRQQMPWYSRVWAAITWVIFTLILRCDQPVYGIEDGRLDEDGTRSRVNSAHEALELIDEEAEVGKEKEQEEAVQEEKFNRPKSEKKKEKFGRGISLFSKVKKQVEERLETARASETPKKAVRRETLTSEARSDRLPSTSSTAGPSTSSSFQSLVSKGVSAGKALKETIQNLNERGDRLEATSDATERLADSTRGYAATSSALLAKYKGKGGLFG